MRTVPTVSELVISKLKEPDPTKRLGIECNINEEDLRKKRYSSTYVQSLEVHIASLETTLKNLIETFYPNNQQILDKMMIGDILPDTINENNNGDSSLIYNQNIENRLRHEQNIKSKKDKFTMLPNAIFNNGNNPDHNSTTTTTNNNNNNSSIRNCTNDDNQANNNSRNGKHNSTVTIPTKKKVYPEWKKKSFVKGSLYPEGPVPYKPRPKPHSKTSTGSVNSIGSNSSSAVSLIGSDSSIDNRHSKDSISQGINDIDNQLNQENLNSSNAILNKDNSTASNNNNNNNNSKNDSNSIDAVDDRIGEKRISDLKTTVIKRPVSNYSNEYCINTDPLILQSLSNFYRWLYPGHFIFVHRESFLYGFFNHAKNNYADSHYCSTELIYAMCAIGSRLSPELQNMSEWYYEQSKKTLLKLVFDEQNTASITTVQALFCLAFYELGKGCNQLAWYFSGLAIRVGYDMGFQLDPKVWYTEDSKSQLTDSELEIRSRIYWGCYIADHFICLMLGRTSTLSVSNSTIPESDELPEVEGTEEFRFIGKHVLQISLPLKNLIILSRIVQVFTSKIFIESDDTSVRVQLLIVFNSQVFQWRQSLPGFLQWSKKLLQDEEVSTDPTVSYFWYYYYVVLLTFNKPFLEESEESRGVVIEILEDLITLFNNFEKKLGNYNYATLYQLFACLLAITCLKKLLIINESNRDWEKQLRFFHSIFYEKLSPAYKLPNKLQEDDNLEDEQEKQTALNQVNNINYTHDFSLSNEIDDMIKELFGIAYNPAQPL
ncbi:Tea1p PWA37_002358 [Arxiozyma heterogenica]|uniref:Tea1p n=1 Tax=Arxiozyma heterogenica TaxID=278026 RepID=UPI002F0D28EA